MGQHQTTRKWTAGFGPCFHLGFLLGVALFFSHSQLGVTMATMFPVKGGCLRVSTWASSPCPLPWLLENGLNLYILKPHSQQVRRDKPLAIKAICKLPGLGSTANTPSRRSTGYPFGETDPTCHALLKEQWKPTRQSQRANGTLRFSLAMCWWHKNTSLMPIPSSHNMAIEQFSRTFPDFPGRISLQGSRGIFKATRAPTVVESRLF